MPNPFEQGRRRGGLKAPKFDFGGGSSGQAGQNLLLGYMLAQQKGLGLQQQLGPGAIATGGTDPATGAKFDTKQSRFFTADAQNQLNRITQLKTATKQYEQLANALPAGLVSGGVEALKATITRGNFGTGEIKTYMDARPALAAGVYRAVTGDNRLSDLDASARSLPLFWHPAEGEDTRENKFSFLNLLLDEAERNITPGEPTSKIESLARFQGVVNRAKEKYQQGKLAQTGASASSNFNIDQERELAIQAIQTGKNRQNVAKRFKQRTGIDFNG